jgi:hypothetical protein
LGRSVVSDSVRSEFKYIIVVHVIREEGAEKKEVSGEISILVAGQVDNRHQVESNCGRRPFRKSIDPAAEQARS